MMRKSDGKTEEGILAGLPISSFVKKRAPILTACILLIVALLGTTLYTFHERAENNKKLNKSKILALINSNNCSSKATQSVESEKANTKEINVSILLLMYRSSCYEQHGKYQQAIATYTELKTYYKIQKNASGIKTLDDAIYVDKVNITASNKQLKSNYDASKDPTLIRSPLTATRLP